MPPKDIVSKTVAMALCVMLVPALFSTRIPRVFGFIPAHTFSVHSYPWNILTYVIVEPNPFICIGSVIFMLHIGAAVEGGMGSLSFLQLLILAAMSTSCILLVASALLYGLGFSWFLQCFCGIWPIAAAILVQWVAVGPRSYLLASLLPRQLQRQYVPTILILLALTVDCIFRSRHRITTSDIDGVKVFPGSVLLPTLFGFGVAWKLQPFFDAGSIVSLAVLFKPLALGFSALLGSDPLSCEEVGEHYESVGEVVAIPVLQGATNTSLLPGSTEEEAQRRRTIALTALNMKLQQMTPASSRSADRGATAV
ncbi:putative rhomboid-like protein [Trypanosoma vivax]|nr:putative rhomboid-like protein [Trypanosoma vivax]